MKSGLRFLAAVLAFIMLINLTGCSGIDETELRRRAATMTPAPETDPDDEDIPPAFNENMTVPFPVTRRAFSEKLQFEEITNYEASSEHEGFEGDGYVLLEQDWSADFELNVPTPQHYSIVVRAKSNFAAADAVIALAVGGEQQGAFYAYNEFSQSALHGIYLDAGVNRLSLVMVSGAAMVDFVMVTDFEMPESRFHASRTPVNPNASINTALLLSYFGDIYGSKILLAQHVTTGTNTEIGTIFSATGRLPAIRFSDLMRYSLSFTGDKPVNDDMELALKWAENGGIVGYDWTWYSPSAEGRSHYYAGASDFKLDDAFTSAHIADLDADRLQSLYDAGAISRQCLELILELDHTAELLKPFRDANVPVLWRPLHQAGTGWFWWGNCRPESYKWLWKLMFERYSSYHGLDNLIWVWSGQDADFYPGDSYVDIIGEDIYNTDNSSFAPQFVRAGGYTARNKFTALTECGRLPSPDLLNRDKALWLWTALYRGDYLTDSRGQPSGILNRSDRLEYIYNHELTVTLDKLPAVY